MKLIGWDTSSKTGALCALEWETGAPRLISEWTLNVDSTHSERLLWGVDQLLASARWKKTDVDLFAVGVGPGSFTGLRIGLTTARTLAHALHKPLIGVSSLAALARPAALWLRETSERTVLVAATDACKGELFALYGGARSVADCVCAAEGERAGLWKRGVEERVTTPDELARAVKRKMSEGKGAASSWALLGEGKDRYPEAWRILPKAKRIEIPPGFLDQVQGRYLGILAWEAYQAGLARQALLVHPRYLRASDAEVKLKAGLLAPAPTRGPIRPS